jgi:hypothetical protein
MNTYRACQMFALLALALVGCGNQSASQVGISPTECTLEVGGQMTFAVDGHIADNAIVIWQADRGSVAFTGQGLNSVFTAPETPGDVNISAIITSGTPVPQSITRTCHVNDSNPQPTSTTGSTFPTSTDITLPTSTLGNSEKTVIISEVMGNPCGGDEFRKWNDYVELYNYGDQPQDVAGLWLAVSGPDNKADMLVAWSTRNPNVALNQPAITNSTHIPAHGFALVLSPTYTKSLNPHKMPYRFPKGTVILTIAEGDRIGHTVYGIIGHGGGRDVVVLYNGGAKSILQVISTYGSPLFLGLYPQDIRDNRADNLPLDLHTCSSAERVNPLGSDTFEGWREVLNGSPGEAPYP